MAVVFLNGTEEEGQPRKASAAWLCICRLVGTMELVAAKAFCGAAAHGGVTGGGGGG